MKRHQTSSESILRDLLPELPDRFTINEVLNAWPREQPRTRRSINLAASAMTPHRLKRDGRHPRGFYFKQVQPKPFKHTHGEVKWAAFKKDPSGYLATL